MPVVNTIKVQEDRKSKLRDFRRLVEATRGWDEDTDVDIVLGSLVGDDGEAAGPCFTLAVRRDVEEVKPSKPLGPTPRGPQVNPLPLPLPRDPEVDRWATFNKQTGRGPHNPDEPSSFTAQALNPSGSAGDRMVEALSARLGEIPDTTS